MPEFENKGPQGANRDGEMEPRTGPQPLSHRRPGNRIIKSNSVSAALHDYLHNNPGGFDMRFYARRYGVSVGSLTMRLWREKRKKKENDATEALDSDEETMEGSRIETPAALARPTTATGPERQSLTFPIPKPGKKASREVVEAAFDEYLHSSPPVSGLDIAKKYGLHPSTMNKRIALTKMSKDVARSPGDSGKKTRSERAINLRSNPPSSRRQQEAGVKPGIPGKSIPPPPPPLRPPPTAAVPTPAPTSASGPKQARSLSTLRARVDRINSAMEYIIQNPGHCYKHVAKRFGVGRRTLFGRAAKLRAAGINVPSSTIPGRMPAKRNTYITTGGSSSSSSRHGDVQVQQQRQQRQQPSGGSAEKAIAAVIRARRSTSQRPRQDQGQGESQKQDPTEKKKEKEKESASQPRPQPQSHQERERGRGLGLRSSSRIKAAAQTSVNAGVSSSNSNSTSTSTSNSSTSNSSRSKEKCNNDNNPLDYMSRAERCDAAWEEYLCSNPRPSLLYFARKYGIHKSTLSARKGALKKQGVDVDLLFMDPVKADTNGNAIASGAGRGRMTRVEDLISDFDLEELEESESELGSEANDGGDDEIIDAESNVTSPPSSKLVLARRQSMQLSDIQERYLVNWYLREESLGRGAPSRAKLTSMALSLLFDGQEVDLDLQDEEWLGILIQQFLERNPDIKLIVGRAEGEDGIWGEEVMGGLVPAQKMRKPKDGVRMLWGPTAAEAAAAAAAMDYIPDENDDEGDWEDEEESDSEQSESDESATDSEDSEEDDSDSDSDPDSDSDSDSDTSTSTSNDNLYNQAFVESLFVKLESTPSPPLLSPAATVAVAATEGGHEHSNLPTPQSSHDIQQHYLSALHNSQSATQTVQIVKTLCLKTGKALDLKNSALEALREKADRLEKEAGELKKAILEITAAAAAAAAAAAGKQDGLLLNPSPDPGSMSSPPLGLLSSEERHEREEDQQQEQEGQEGKRSSSSGSINMSSVSDVDAEREILERVTTTTTTDKGLRASSSSITPPSELEEVNSMQESVHGGSNEAGGQGNGESEESESGCDNEHKGSDTKSPSFLTDDTSTIVLHDNSRKRRRMVDIEIVLEAKKMLGFAAHDESIGPWTGAYTIGPGAPGKKRRRITERNRQGGGGSHVTIPL
ncbi:uncharacterized protein B0T23DRAFT_109085 [Neurospora hispaniola]|uniref:Uncharacterized protein n=1 Tax=Neurospora hispaniola TaxID=588809 RepID=A0AAJ0MS90_9PEZI|nr:hypothetical protein B0T23DRAFT_109085 [Neurospora hispaniola]